MVGAVGVDMRSGSGIEVNVGVYVGVNVRVCLGGGGSRSVAGVGSWDGESWRECARPAAGGRRAEWK